MLKRTACAQTYDMLVVNTFLELRLTCSTRFFTTLSNRTTQILRHRLGSFVADTLAVALLLVLLCHVRFKQQIW